MRTSKSELDQLVRLINSTVGADANDYELDNAYGSNCLVRKMGSVTVSPRLPSGQLANWMRAFIAGSEARRTIDG